MRRNKPVMAPHTSAHPLDTDIFDLIEGSIDAASAQLVEAHLQQCLLCRIKRQRLSDAPPIDFADTSGLTVPEYSLIDVQRSLGIDARRGELWLTVGDEALMVLVRTVRTAPASGLVVVPVTFDVEAADDETLVLDQAFSPIDAPLAIYEHLTVSIPAAALVSRISPSRDVDLLTIAAGQPGVTRGSAIDGPTDPRLEFRQYLTDLLTSLDPVLIEAPDDESSIDTVFDEMVEHLRFTRGPETCVDPLELHGVGALPGWAGVAIVDELTVRVVVIDTSNGITDDLERQAAEEIFTKWHASALVVCTSAMSEMADVYDYAGLVGRTVLDSGTRSSGPLFMLPVNDAVSKFLDQKTSIPTTPGRSAARGAAVDAQAILNQQVVDALASVVATGQNANIKSKRAGLTSVASSLYALTEVLQQAFTAEFDVQAVIEVANQANP